MKPESLHALLIDRELKELPPDTLELLEAWLAEHPESTAALAAVRQTLETTGAAVRRFPELARPELDTRAVPFRSPPLVPLAWAASILLLLGGTAWVGFRVGQDSAPAVAVHKDSEPAAVPGVSPARPDDPWARYALASDQQGGLTVIRRDRNSHP
jgi:hypothetical protein